MASFVALLRAVNVGGTGKLAMSDLKAVCESAGLSQVRTYIASGNVVFTSDSTEQSIKVLLKTRLESHTGYPVGVLVRTATAMADIVARNPFPDAPGGHLAVVFLEHAATPDILDDVSGRADDEELRLGHREIYVWYGSGMGRSKLRTPAARTGTARNMNTVAKLSIMAAASPTPPASDPSTA
jgi:uncharacterized protein (DUF1697 family)